MSIDPKFFEFTADVLEIFFFKYQHNNHYSGEKQNMYRYIYAFFFTKDCDPSH